MQHQKECSLRLDKIILSTLFFITDDKKRKATKTLNFRAFREAQTGFEPVNNGVADRCLTTWLLRHILYEVFKLASSK